MAVNASNVTDYSLLAAYGEVWLASCRTANVFYGTISSLACLLNVVALGVILCSKMSEAATFYLINLVIVDLITPALQITLIAIEPDCYYTYRFLFSLDSSTIDIVFLSLSHCLQSVAFYGYLLNAVFMILDRFVATWQPFSYQRLVTKTRVALSIVCVWFLSVVMGFLPYITSLASLEQLKTSRYTHNKTLMEVFFADMYANMFTSLQVLFFTACVIFCWILFVYVVIFRAIRRHHKFLQLTHQQSKGILKGAVTSALIVGSYALCWLPFGISGIVYRYFSGIDVKTYATLTQWKNANFGLVLLNSVCDPIIYIMINTKFRSSLVRGLKVCGCDCQRRANRRRSSSSNRLTLSTIFGHGRRQQTRSADLVTAEQCEEML